MKQTAYYILDNDHTEGPFCLLDLREMYTRGAVTGQTLYAQDGFDQWVPLQDLADSLHPFKIPPPIIPRFLHNRNRQRRPKRRLPTPSRPVNPQVQAWPCNWSACFVSCFFRSGLSSAFCC